MIGIERFGSRLDHAIAGWRVPKCRLMLTKLFVATFEQTEGVVEASRFLYSIWH